jgi:hypothetical protein
MNPTQRVPVSKVFGALAVFVGTVFMILIIVSAILGNATKAAPYRTAVVQGVTCVQQTPQSMWRCP